IILYPHTFIHIAFFSCITRLYGNVMMLTLNTRDYLRGCDPESNTLSVPSFASGIGSMPETFGISRRTELSGSIDQDMTVVASYLESLRTVSSESIQATSQAPSYPELCHFVSHQPSEIPTA
ncbi:hypothetical protein CPB83DRAFT_841385, partial [Crepidotus variabilis]